MRFAPGEIVRLYLRAAAFAVALFAVYIFASPIVVGAQSGPSAQQVEIGELQRRAGANDAFVRRLQVQEQKNASTIAEMEGEARVMFAVVSLLTGGSFVSQVIGEVTKRERSTKHG